MKPTVPAIICLLGLSMGSSRATLIQTDFTARVDSIFDDANLLFGQVTVGQTGTGYFQYDTGMIDAEPDPDWGDYGPAMAFQFRLGGYTFQQSVQSPDGRLVVVNNAPFFGDTFLLESLNNTDDVPGAFSAHLILMELRQFESAGATVFNSDDLPADLVLNDFAADNRYLSIGFSPGLDQVINLTVTSMATHAVPEPATIVPVVIATGLLLARRRASKRR